MKKPRHKRRADKRPDEILDAALACFTDVGYAATRVEDIADKAGISKATVYLYFVSKHELLTGLVRRALVPIPKLAETAVAVYPGTVHQAMKMFVTMIARRLSHDNIVAIPLTVLRESTVFPELAVMYRTEVLDRAIPIGAAIIQKGIDSGEFRAVDPELAVRSLVGPLLAHLLLSHVFGIGDSDEAGMKALLVSHLDILMQGLEVR